MLTLVKNDDNEVRAGSDMIAEGVGNPHATIIRLVRDNLNDLQEFGRVGFEIAPFETAGGTQNREIALLNEPQATLLLTYMRNNDQVRGFKKTLVRTFYEMRETATAKIDYSDPSVLAGVMASLQETIANQDAALEAVQPKVAFFDQFVNADGLYGLQNAARALQARPNLFIRWLKSEYIFYQGGNLIPRVQFTQRGLFEVKTTMVDDKVRPQAFITPRGLDHLRNKMPDNVLLKSA